MRPLIVLTTVGADFQARELATALVEARVAACVNIIPAVQSIYRWQGKIESDGEQLLVIKTTDEKLDALEAELMRRHPYQVPEFVVIAVESIRGPYLDWLASSLAG